MNNRLGLMPACVAVMLCSGICRGATDAGMNAFVDNLMGRMTLEEKIGQLNLPAGGDVVSGQVFDTDLAGLVSTGRAGGFFNVKGVDRITEFQRLAVEKSRLGIPLLIGADVIHGYETVFPIPIALSCSWNPEAIERMARISAIEASADGVNWTFSPMVDICRDARWGRIAEGSGEDPWLGSLMAAAYVRGYQGTDMSRDNEIMACVKHFAAYGAPEAGRDYTSVDMSAQKLFNYYLPPYKAAVEAGVGSVMTSFNLLNGEHPTASRRLLDDILRTRWGFNGMVVTDYNSISDMATLGLAEKAEAAAMSLKAGTDMDMVSNAYLGTLAESYKKGLVTMTEIDNACRRVLEAKYKLGLFSDPYKYCKPRRAKTELYTEAHLKAAREIAAETFVLLKNDNGLLPLRKKGKIALIGPLADAGNNMCGMWSQLCVDSRHISLLQAFREELGKEAELIYAQGSNVYYSEKTQQYATGRRAIPRGDDGELLREALDAAAKADVIVAALGESSEMSGESASRSDITIPDAQRDLLKKLVATGKPVVLLLFTGRPLALDWESENVPAILNVWYAGSEAGHAVSDAVFGRTNPCGRLTTTFPRAVGQEPLYYNYLQCSRPPWTDDHFAAYSSSYIDVPNTPLYPFGFGLSYTTFDYGEPVLSSDIISDSKPVRISVAVTNTGKREGVETVQLYIHDCLASLARPVKELKNYQRVTLKPGETKKVEFTLTVEDLKFYNADLKLVYEPGDFEIMVGPDSGHLNVKRIQGI